MFLCSVVHSSMGWYGSIIMIRLSDECIKVLHRCPFKSFLHSMESSTWTMLYRVLKVWQQSCSIMFDALLFVVSCLLGSTRSPLQWVTPNSTSEMLLNSLWFFAPFGIWFLKTVVKIYIDSFNDSVINVNDFVVNVCNCSGSFKTDLNVVGCHYFSVLILVSFHASFDWLRGQSVMEVK